MTLARISLGIRRSGSVENEPESMAYNTFGWTPVALIKQTIPNFRRLLTLCLAGTRMRLNVTFTYQMYRRLSRKQTIVSPNLLGNRLSEKSDGLRGVGPFKSSLPQVQSNSSLEKAS